MAEFSSELKPAFNPEFMAALSAAYQVPPRHYHTLGHARGVARLVAGMDGDRACQLAAWTHDVVYDPLAGDNEDQSARWLLDALPDDPDVVEAARLVRLTASHDPGPDDRSGQILCDADLAVLGGAPAAYEAYRQAVRREFGHLPDAAWASGRAVVLRGLLGRERLYHTPTAARWEAAARRNLHAELRSLLPPPHPRD